MVQVAIPRINLPLGQRIFGPFNVGQHNQLVIDIDRTTANGLNATPAALFDVTIQVADDPVNGPWTDAGNWTGIPGGILLDHNGNTRTDLPLSVNIDSARQATRQGIRVITNVTGARFFIVGTVTATFVPPS